MPALDTNWTESVLTVWAVKDGPYSLAYYPKRRAVMIVNLLFHWSSHVLFSIVIHLELLAVDMTGLCILLLDY